VERRRRRQGCPETSASSNLWRKELQEMCDTIRNNNAVDNSRYLRIFSSKIPLVFHLMESELHDEEQQEAAKTICDACKTAITRINGDYWTLTQESCLRNTDPITRYIVSMDTSMIADIVISCLIKKDQYENVLNEFIQDISSLIISWGTTARKYICDIPPGVIPYLTNYPDGALCKGKTLSYVVEAHKEALSTYSPPDIYNRSNKHSHNHLSYLDDD